MFLHIYKSFGLKSGSTDVFVFQVGIKVYVHKWFFDQLLVGLIVVI